MRKKNKKKIDKQVPTIANSATKTIKNEQTTREKKERKKVKKGERRNETKIKKTQIEREISSLNEFKKLKKKNRKILSSFSFHFLHHFLFLLLFL
jgi:hypothetical protein